MWLLRGACMVALGGVHCCSGGACMVALGAACVVALGGVCVVAWGGRHAWFFPGTCVVAPGGYAWFFWGACMVAPRGACMVFPGCMRRIRRDMVNERAVHILLECILVHA